MLSDPAGGDDLVWFGRALRGIAGAHREECHAHAGAWWIALPTAAAEPTMPISPIPSPPVALRVVVRARASA